MNILIVSEVFYPEDFHVNDFAKTLAERGYNVQVLTRQPSYPAGVVYSDYKNENYSTEKWGDITIHRVSIVEGYKKSKIRKIANYINFVRQGRKVILNRIKNIDLIIVYQTGPLSVALPAIYAKKKFGIPVIVWTFDIWPDTVYMYGFPNILPIRLIVNHIIKKVYSNADSIMVSSTAFSETIKRYVSNKNITYAPNWLVETAQQESSLVLDSSKTNFTFTGNVSKAQNLENTLQGFVKADIKDALFNVVGDGSYLEYLKKTFAPYSNIVFHGRIPYSQVYSVLGKSDFLVLPLTSKSGVDKTEPYKLQSYLKSGKPILGIIKGAGREIIESNKLGVCCNPDDIDDISRGFRDILKIGNKEREDIFNASQELMQLRYSKNLIMNTIEDVISGCKKV